MITLASGAHARAGNEDAYRRAIERAGELLQAPHDSSVERPRVPFFDATYFAEEQASSLSQLGRAGRSRCGRGRASRCTWSVRPWLLLDLAFAYARGNDPEAAAEAARQTLEQATDSQMQTVLTTLPGLLSELRPHHRLPAVRQLEEQLRGVIWVPGQPHR